MRKKTILWLDDDFEFDKQKLKVWIRALDLKQDRLKYIAVSNLDAFVKILKEKSNLQPNDDGYIDAILIDVMLMEEPEPYATFAILGFPDEKWLCLEAGAQILGMMQNEKLVREKWLEAYVDRQSALFTSMSTINVTWSTYVSENVRTKKTFKAIVKADRDGGTHSLASQDFINWMDSLHET